jgi:8-oxo-dGTP pyrophosphatase MutT (NUDIX family)
MAPSVRKRYATNDLTDLSYTNSAVMILFCVDEKETIFIPLTARETYKGAHSGQISFPGGKYEENDLSLQNTAIRECYEEIGIKEDIEIIGQLTNLYIPVSGFLVEPFVGICTTINPVFTHQSREVKEIIKLPLNLLLDDAIIKTGIVQSGNDFSITAPFFLHEEYKIWGATAMILNELKVVLKTIF